MGSAMDEGIKAALGGTGSIDLDLDAIDLGLLIARDDEDAFDGREGVAEFDVFLLDLRFFGVDGVALGLEGGSGLFFFVEANHVVADLGDDAIEFVLDATEVKTLKAFGDVGELVLHRVDILDGDKVMERIALTHHILEAVLKGDKLIWDNGLDGRAEVWKLWEDTSNLVNNSSNGRKNRFRVIVLSALDKGLELLEKLFQLGEDSLEGIT